MLPTGCWSPSRPGVLLLTDQSGGVEVWDLLDRSHVPVLRAAAASSPLSSLSLAMVALPGSGSAALQLLAVGDSAGTLRILELPRSLRRQVGRCSGCCNVLPGLQLPYSCQLAELLLCATHAGSVLPPGSFRAWSW